MTYRTMRTSITVALALVAAVACGHAASDAHATSTTGASSQPGQGAAGVPVRADSSLPGTRSSSSTGDIAKRESTSLATNHLGRIPILEYHVIGSAKNGLYSRTAESFRKDLEDVYARGYRPITVSRRARGDVAGDLRLR